MESETQFANEYSVERTKEFRDLLVDITGRVKPENLDSFQDKKDEKIFDLRSKYGDSVKNYAMWHVLGGSTIVPSMSYVTFDDFPGGDSVAEFINELGREY